MIRPGHKYSLICPGLKWLPRLHRAGPSTSLDKSVMSYSAKPNHIILLTICQMRCGSRRLHKLLLLFFKCSGHGGATRCCKVSSFVATTPSSISCCDSSKNYEQHFLKPPVRFHGRPITSVEVQIKGSYEKKQPRRMSGADEGN